MRAEYVHDCHGSLVTCHDSHRCRETVLNSRHGAELAKSIDSNRNEIFNFCFAFEIVYISVQNLGGKKNMFAVSIQCVTKKPGYFYFVIAPQLVSQFS